MERASKFGSILGRDRGLVNNCSAAAGRAPNWTGRTLNHSYNMIMRVMILKRMVLGQRHSPQKNSGAIALLVGLPNENPLKIGSLTARNRT